MVAGPRSTTPIGDDSRLLDVIPGQPRPATLAAAVAAAAERAFQSGGLPTPSCVLAGGGAAAGNGFAGAEPELASQSPSRRAGSSGSASSAPSMSAPPLLSPQHAAHQMLPTTSSSSGPTAPIAQAAPSKAAAASRTPRLPERRPAGFKRSSPAPQAQQASAVNQGSQPAFLPPAQSDVTGEAVNHEAVLAAAAAMLQESVLAPAAASADRTPSRGTLQRGMTSESSAGNLGGDHAASRLAAERMAGLGPQARSRVIAAALRAATSVRAFARGRWWMRWSLPPCSPTQMLTRRLWCCMLSSDDSCVGVFAERSFSGWVGAAGSACDGELCRLLTGIRRTHPRRFLLSIHHHTIVCEIALL